MNKTTHTDHPLCHYDRTCSACNEPTPQGTNGVTGKADAGPVVVGLELASGPPSRIWLQPDPDDDSVTEIGDCSTWSQDSVGSHDVEYVLAATVERLVRERDAYCEKWHKELVKGDQLAAMTQERNEWKKCYSIECANHKSTMVRLAASQAREQQFNTEVARLKQVCRNVYEVWAGSEGIPVPETCSEAYLLRLVEQMRDEAKAGL